MKVIKILVFSDDDQEVVFNANVNWQPFGTCCLSFSVLEMSSSQIPISMKKNPKPHETIVFFQAY